MDQIRLAPNRTSAFMSTWQNDISGNTFSSNLLTGRTAVSLLRNQGYASRVVSMRVSEQDVQDASRQVDAARSEAVAASTERSAVLSEAFTKGLSKLRSTRSSTGSTTTSIEQVGQTLTRLDQITRSVADSTGMSQSQIARIAFGASGHLGLSTAAAGAQANANAEKGYITGLTADERKVLGSLTTDQIAEFKQFGDLVSRDSSFATAIASDSREAREMASRLSSSAARTTRADASLSDRTSYSERVSSAYERGETISMDIAQDPHNLAMFTRYAEQYGGNSAAAHAMMEAELARQALRPNRTFSDGTGVPSTFDRVRVLAEQHRADVPVTPSTNAYHRSNRDLIAQIGTVEPAGTARPNEPSPMRAQVQARAREIRTAADSNRTSFDAKAEIVNTDDGTLASRRSLLMQSGRQIGKDATGSLENARDAVKDLLNKK
jgi:conjugal transfer mating pair stabilization protein TraG